MWRCLVRTAPLVLVILLAVCTSHARASLCPSAGNLKDVENVHACSEGRTGAEWGRCMICKGSCDNLARFSDTCLLGYGQIVSLVADKDCTLDAELCNKPFGALLNATCTQGLDSITPCSSLALIPIIAGSVGGGILLLILVAFCLDYRRRREKRRREERRHKREQRKARDGASSGTLTPGSSKQKWRPSFVNKRTKGKGITAMSSAPLPSPGSFRGPPPGPPPALASNGSFRGPPPGQPPALASHGSFRGPPPGPHPGLASHNSFHGMPPQMQQPALAPHNSFHGAPPGVPPLPPPSRNSGAIMGGGPPAPPVPPSRNSGAIAAPNPAPAAPAPASTSNSGGGGGGANDLLEQIKKGKQLKKTETSDGDKPAEKKEEKPAGGGGGGGGGGLMAELQRKMKKKQG